MLRVNIRPLALYAFSLVIMYLAGVYFGTFLFVLFITFLVLPLISFVSFLIWIAGVGCEQEIGKSAPVKGDVVKYRLNLRNRGVLPIPIAGVHFANVSEALRATLPDFEAYLPARRTYETSYDITCPYRGTYELGVKEIVVRDQLRFFEFRKRIEPIKVTVYPRVLVIPRFAPVAQDIEGVGRYSSAGLLPDSTLFYQLKEYRDGDSIRHIYWKKFASTGKPFLKDYDRTKRAGVRIYLDVIPSQRRDINRLEQEDVSIEALVAVVRYLLFRRVHTTVIAGTNPRLAFTGQDAVNFEKLYDAAARVSFSKGAPVDALFRSDLLAGMLESQTCVFITHNLDARTVTLTEGSEAYDTILLLNRAGIPERRLEEFDRFVGETKRRGRNVVVLRGSNTLVEDLSGHALAFTETLPSMPTGEPASTLTAGK